MTLDSHQLAWAAGFFDGEGYLGMPKLRQRRGGWGYAAPVLKVGQCEPTTLERFRLAVGEDMGNIRGPFAPPDNGISKQQKWEFSAHGRKALAVGKLLYPMLSGPKRAQYDGVVAASVAIKAAREQALAKRQAPGDLARFLHLYYQEQRSTEECAALLGLSVSGLRRWMRAAGYTRRNPAEGRWATARRLG